MRRQVKTICLGLVLVLAFEVRCLLGIDLVVPSGPYPTIQSAIDVAVDYDDRVVVSVGTYYENINFGGKAITVTSTDPNDPEIVATTIIDGSLATEANSGSTVTFNSGEGNDSVLTGFTITGGSGTWLVIAWDFHEPYWNLCGGGIVCYDMSEPTITRNVISDNLAGEGGGIYVYGDPVNISAPSNPAVHLRPVVSDNTFYNNSAVKKHGNLPPDENYVFAEHGDGGAIVCFQGVDPVITGNIIQENHADYYGGGMHLRQWSDGEISNNQILGNDSLLGAAIHVTYRSSPDISNNYVFNNIGPGGSGLYIYYNSNPVVENNIIINNVSSNSGGIGVYWSSQPYIHHNLIAKNQGIGIYCNAAGSIGIYNNTIADNYSTISGSGIRYKVIGTGFMSVVENNIIVSNDGGYGIEVDSSSASKVTIKYNNVWDNEDGNYNSMIGDQTGVNGNISVDPLFVVDLIDYHLKSNGWRWDETTSQWSWDGTTSRCIDAGNPGYSLAEELLFVPDDPGGQRSENLRINMGFYGGTAEASLGPYSWALLADMTNDGVVDMTDIAIFSGYWLESGQQMPADIHRDQNIDLQDLGVLAEDWLESTSWH